MDSHPYADCFPMLSEAELLTLQEDIQTNGQVQPIIVDQYDRIIDGRNRKKACDRLGVEVVCERRNLTDQEALHLVASLNLHRRHLTPSDRAKAGAKLANLSKGGLGGYRVGDSSQETSPPKPVSIEDAAEATGASISSIKRRKKIERDGSPELISAVDDGVVDMATAADAISNLPKEEQPAVVEDLKHGRKTRQQIRESSPRRRVSTTDADDSKVVEDKKPEGEYRGKGVQRAHEAIACLKRIPKNDALRKRGFQIVYDYVKNHM